MKQKKMKRLAVVACAILAVCAWRSFRADAAYDDWKFDQAKFEERLGYDWLLQDGLSSERCFRSSRDAEAERVVIDAILKGLETDEKADSYGEEFVYAASLDANAPEFDGSKVDASTEGVEALRSRFEELVADNKPAVDPQWRELYFDVCRVRRARRLADAAEIAPSFVYTKHYVIGASHYAYTEDVTDEWYKDYSCNRQPGGQLIRADFAPDGSIRNEILVETPRGTLRDPDVSWDGERVLFSMRNDLDKDDFHLYEYDVNSKKTRQITSGKGVADIEPIYLPNGDLLFGSTRCTQITDCWRTEVSNFYTCDDQGRFLRRISFDQVTVNYPKLLDDGRVVYTRWDYNDRGQIYPQPLFQMYPDGTAQTEFYGNNSYFPTTIMHARGVPGSDRVLAVAGGHHTYQHGKLILIDRANGNQENEGCVLVAPIRETPADRIDQYGQEDELFAYPLPLDESTLLCAYTPNQGRMNAWNYFIPFGIYWFNYDGERELLAYDPAISCGQPILLAERDKPVLRPSQVDLNKTTGKYYVQDVYEGPGLKGIERGVVKALRVVALEFRVSDIRGNGNGGPAGGALSSMPPAVTNGSWDVKHVLGEVPVEEDGSAYFEVPARTPVYFQLLDANGDVVQTMRSWSTLQPGETFACVGCHEPKGSVIANAVANDGATTIALKKGVAQLKPVLNPGKGAYQNAGFSFPRDIQPILDAHCVSCHTGDEGAPFSLLGNESQTPMGVDENNRAGRRFSEAYLNLTNYGNHEGPWIDWLGIQEGPELLPPYKEGAFKSKLVTMFRSPDGQYGGQDENHRNVKIDEASVKLLALWIDLLVPYCGDYLEDNNWNREERARYAYYWTKRLMNDELDAFHMELKRIADEKNDSSVGNDSRCVWFGGMEDRDLFFSSFGVGRKTSVARRAGKLNVYRNVAVNPRDAQADDYDAQIFPHATSNSEYAYLDEFAAKNVIDGKTENRGHGPDFPSWGPNLRTDLWLNVDFGCEVEIDKCVVYLRADFPHDDVWESGTLVFSDGSTLDVTFEETAEPQTFTFDKKRVTSVKLTNLKAKRPLKWAGVSEIEFWGTSVEE